MKEYEFNGSIEINFYGQGLGKLKLAEIKNKWLKELKEYFENNDNIVEYDVYSEDINIEYDEIEE